MGEGNGIREFFCSCDSDYLLKNLWPNKHRFEPDIDATINNLKKRLIWCRREGQISKENLREFWDLHISPYYGSLNSCSSTEELALWVNNNYEIYECQPFEEWYFDIEQKLTSDAEWLKDTIIPIVQKVLREEI